MSDISKLQSINEAILKSNSPGDYYKSVKALNKFYSKYISTSFKTSLSFSPVRGGKAINTLDAANCLNDYVRTALFLKGINQAIQDLLAKFKTKKIHIVYAGCGPLATLLIPLLPLYSKKPIEITFIDIHKESIDSVNGILNSLKLNHLIKETLIMDASFYQTKKNNPIHLLLSETMMNALITEPQTTIISAISPQLHKNGILIPQEITIEFIIDDFSKLKLFNQNTDKPNYLKELMVKKTGSKKIFSLTKSSCFAKNKIYKSKKVKIKQTKGDIILLTNINVYKNIKLQCNLSNITKPYCVNTLTNFATHNFFKFIYDFNGLPEWKFVSA